MCLKGNAQSQPSPSTEPCLIVPAASKFPPLISQHALRDLRHPRAGTQSVLFIAMSCCYVPLLLARWPHTVNPAFVQVTRSALCSRPLPSEPPHLSRQLGPVYLCVPSTWQGAWHGAVNPSE